MKKAKLITLILSLSSMAACQSKDDIYVGPPDKDNDKVTDLVVPEGFDWEMSQDATLSIESGVKSIVDVFRSADCKAEDLIATLNAPTEDVTLSIPVGTEKLYVQYTQTNGKKNVLPVALTESRAETNKIGHAKLPEDAGETKESGEGPVLYYPSNGWGTVLFEDNWPEMGDYDMNDFAVWYKIQQYITGPNETYAIMISVTMTAMGGSYPYQLCLGIDGLNINNIEECSDPYGQNSYKATLSKSGDAILTYHWDGLKGSEGGSYYNTEDAYAPVDQAKLKKNQVSYIIYLEKNMKIFSHKDFDFFLKRKDNGAEIHLKGYKPSTGFMSTYNEITNSNSNLSNRQYYATTDGFVWGIKVPKGIGHPKEQIDITEAYSYFADWVTSGGKSQTDWYNTAEEGKCVSVQIE